MPVHLITSDIEINKPASEVFAWLTTVKNWAGVHPATKDITGPAGINSPATVGLNFTEVVDTPGIVADVDWEVRKIIKDEYFEIIFPVGHSTPPMKEVVVQYSLTPLGENKTHFQRNMVNFVEAGVETAALEKSTIHDAYIKKVKAILEG